jgi:death-on-curing protein
VLAIHEVQIAQHGGAPGIRDRALLQSALARPQHAAAYADAGVPELAALYAIGVIKNHPFYDGNKRVGAILLETFLQLNAFTLEAVDAELFRAILGLAANDLNDQAFVAWVRMHARPQKR